MIFIISSIDQERLAISSICQAKMWPSIGVRSLREFRRVLGRIRPKIVIVRHQLNDGYSDEVIRVLKPKASVSAPSILVLAAGNSSLITEIRQIELGADHILRDPVCAELLATYISKYRHRERVVVAKDTPLPYLTTFKFAGGNIDPVKRKWEHLRHSVNLSPREIELCRILAEARGLLTYEILYDEIFGRTFRGDTSNIRVLISKLKRSAHCIKIDLSRRIHTIPKLGCRYIKSSTRYC